MENFYTPKAKARGYIKDVKWLNQDWRLVQAHPVEYFSLEVKTSGLLHSEAAKVHRALDEDVLQKYSRFSLMTTLKCKSGSTFVNFMDVAAVVPRIAMLNDALKELLGCLRC
ncbi:hypothetical protein PPTG_24675 [Phytophthora nicotianae INRA-310]|uniref:Uncharacterized protein n=1 Tax=Phytophthora nicotianae (strain INRA-310) TaxID=761204 RepID=W2PB26_PHYN3|nr:hypothetical protein PPTG_24675 [Phytophthora nicotianae INRA-310]ETM98257.1 hypothetical protein PPTG_24675 [Phytophthora nicotianae INRA-310]